MMRSAGYTHFLEDINQLMDEGMKSSQPPSKAPWCVVESNLTTKWYGLQAIPPGRTECRRHRVIKWSNFCEGKRHVFAPETRPQPPRTEKKRSGEEGLIFDLHRNSSPQEPLHSILHHDIHCIRERLIHTCKIRDCKLYSYLRPLRLDWSWYYCGLLR